jgi:hypothetical protein
MIDEEFAGGAGTEAKTGGVAPVAAAAACCARTCSMSCWGVTDGVDASPANARAGAMSSIADATTTNLPKFMCACLIPTLSFNRVDPTALAYPPVAVTYTSLLH